MTHRHTWFWTLLAAGLFAFIVFYRGHLRKPPSGPPRILPALKASDVTSVILRPGGQRDIRADRTNGGWQLIEPISYPAVASAYMAANFAVLLTHVPGGWGVMEFVLFSILPSLDVIGAVIAFRAIYYLAPLVLGSLLFVTVEGPAALRALISRRASA